MLIYSPHWSYAQKVQTISGEYLYHVPEDATLEIARRTAIERARLQALATAFGTIVSQVNSTHVENTDGRSDLSFLSSGGSEVKGEWIEDTREPVVEIIHERGMLAIRASVAGRAREIVASSIDIEARILKNGTDLRNEDSNFRDGDDMFLYFRTPADGYLVVYLVDDEQQAYCLLPYMSNATGQVGVRNDRDYVFFSSEHPGDVPKQAVDEYTLTCRQAVEQNDIYVVFSTNAFVKANDAQVNDGAPRQLDFAGFQQWLTRSRMRDKGMVVRKTTITVRK